ncbi:MAG: hypothetical protein KJ064_27210 [Anaerolineae bacterium]|jgi:hypothetical protein|nr:MAG: hypothetical protein F9K27_17460 [Anaerolineae bacterium]MCL4880372.1 hypothetical protein [Anaerolineae bacterium]
MKVFNRRFTIAVLGLIPLCLVLLVLLGLAGSRIWERERQLREQRDLLDEQYVLWRRQNIRDYTLTYSNSGIYCQNALMTVKNGVVDAVTPVCSSSYYGSYGSGVVRSMDELFRWVETTALGGHYREVEIEYHPAYHYITRLVIDDEYSASVIEIRYENLKVSQ